ncbi:MAG: phosphate ABC transporter substrate-binding protein [Fibrobacterota bacterium]|mgnify:FL=1
MIKSLKIAMASLSLVAGAIQAQQPEFDGTIRIGGSTTMLPLIADGASQFMEKYETWDKVDPSLPKKQILIFVTGGGSGFGVNSTIGGTVDIGMASRDLKDAEKTKLGTHQAYLVSKDCIAFAVSKKNPLSKIDNLTQDNVVKIWSGEAKNFSDVRKDLPAKPLVVMMRDMAGGSTEMLQKMILKDKTFSVNAIQVPSQGANMKKVEDNGSAITYLSSVIALENPKLKVFQYEGVAPTNENVISGKYPITRPLILIVKDVPSLAKQKFIDFMLNEGQAIVAQHGYVPVKKL